MNGSSKQLKNPPFRVDTNFKSKDVKSAFLVPCAFVNDALTVLWAVEDKKNRGKPVKWEPAMSLLGGKTEPGETPVETVKRECKEETGEIWDPSLDHLELRQTTLPSCP